MLYLFYLSTRSFYLSLSYFQIENTTRALKIDQERKLCVNCLKPYQIKTCPSKSTSHKCDKTLNIYLHFENSLSSPPERSDMEQPNIPTVLSVSAISITFSRQAALLSTALLDVRDKNLPKKLNLQPLSHTILSSFICGNISLRGFSRPSISVD